MQCREHPGSRWNGYARTRFQGKWMNAHRAEWIKHNGPIPNGMVVCHHCDNRSCVEIAHLFLGTNGDNNMDMAAKGRHGIAKLKAAWVPLIRALSGQGVTQKRLGEMCGVHQSVISRCVRGETWTHVGG